MPQFDTLKIYNCGKHCEKRRNCLKQAISPFLTMFSTPYDTYFPFQMHSKMSSAVCFNLDQSEFLVMGEAIHEQETQIYSQVFNALPKVFSLTMKKAILEPISYHVVIYFFIPIHFLL